ncbi:hypothetical protein PRIPAC_80355 [Pristionchus pacificus]|uniref:Uncharacterized protein n=1 Tax=Pristionchus pacificus TaxID=54126 RepID=A0A2A6CNV1_PRIPA|nr:hypothetical protein PRIPAC_80355 [Pristionchus pacificus]|eukprot:PDM79809.1 hypothetical protein PRIPAC_32388 [Pristionchus pacificus]
MSEKLRRSHSKALRMLVAQAINPIIFSYGPISIMGLTCVFESESHVPDKLSRYGVLWYCLEFTPRQGGNGKPLIQFKIYFATDYCGQDLNAILAQETPEKHVDEERSQKYLRDKSTKAVRIDFLGYFREKARPWLKDDIVREGVSLANFIDGTLEFDHRARMSVEQALAHPFLAQVRRPLKEVAASGTIVDVGNASIPEWKQRVWDFIQNHPIR